MTTIRVSELGSPLSSTSPREGNWVTVKGKEDETLRIKSVNYVEQSIRVKHMDGEESEHFFKNILFIGKEYFEPNGK
tara:strand:+ start:196 stop:426 length:231 start_codon:yes stop_codon:yes gene_type:complete